MLKSMCAACAAICLLASPAGAFDIVRDGRAAAVVVVDEKAPASAAKAASEFAAYVGKITGARLEVADAPVAGMATIRVGAPCAAKGTDAISVFVNRKGELEITGREPRGPVYAGDDAVAQAVVAHLGWICGETLAVSCERGEAAGEPADLNGHATTIQVLRSGA